MAETANQVRVDQWTWAVRFYKTRSRATTACKAGHVRVNGERAKPSQKVRNGDEVRVRTDRDHTVVVRELLMRRVGAPIAQAAYKDKTPVRPRSVERPAPVKRERGKGRPTKKERRQLDRLRGQ